MRTIFPSVTLFLLFSLYTSPNFNTIDTKSAAIFGKYIKDGLVEENYNLKTIVIDAGHGGKDPGCSGIFSKEKHVALKIALNLGRTIATYYPEINVVYTRTTDVFIPLHERAAIANRNKADLFISIHCNAVENGPHVHGTETYVMGLHTADENLNVAKRENLSILMEDNYEHHYEGYDPNSPEGHIILSMFQNAYLEQSIQFAQKVEDNFQYKMGRKSRGVKQAGFVVLRKTTMPSVLIETGYLTSQTDENYLAGSFGQTNIANSIFKAFEDYKIEVETGNQVVRNTSQPSTTYASSNANTNLVISSNKDTYTPKPEPISTEYKRTYTKAVNNPAPLEVKQPTYKSENVVRKTVGSTRYKVVEPDMEYKIQLALTDAEVNTKSGKWANISNPIEVKREGNFYRYLAFGYKTFEEAEAAQSQLRQNGFDFAFIVAYEKGKRVR